MTSTKGSTLSKIQQLLCISLLLLLSCTVTIYNKTLLELAPYPITLTTWHMVCATVTTQLLAATTSLVPPCKAMTLRVYVTAVVPVGVCFSGSLILGNYAILYLSMSFVQMLKALGPIITLLACWSLRIYNPPPSWSVFITISIVVSGVMATALGEVQFVTIGFLIQLVAVVAEAYKNALQQRLLGEEVRISSLTLLRYAAPVCTVVNAVGVVVFEREAITAHAFTRLGPGLLLGNGMATFALNVAAVTLIKETSSVTLTLSAIPKILIFCVYDSLRYHVPFTLLQFVGFSIAGYGTYRYAVLGSSSSSGGGGSGGSGRVEHTLSHAQQEDQDKEATLPRYEKEKEMEKVKQEKVGFGVVVRS